MKDKLKIIIAMVFFGTVGLFIRYIPLPSSEIALYRAVIAIFFILAYMAVTKQKIEFAAVKKEGLKLFFSGAAMGVNWICLFEAYQYTSIGLATLCNYFAPAIIIIMSFFIYKEKLSKKQILCFAGSTLGIVMIIGVSGGGTNDFFGVLLGVGSAFFYSAIVLINKSIKSVSGILRTLIQFASVSIVLIPYVAVTGGFHIGEVRGVGLLSLLILGAVHTGLMYVLYFSAISKLSALNLSVLSYIDPFVAVIISVAVLHEHISGTQLAGGALVLLFTLLNEVAFKRPPVKAGS